MLKIDSCPYFVYNWLSNYNIVGKNPQTHVLGIQIGLTVRLLNAFTLQTGSTVVFDLVTDWFYGHSVNNRRQKGVFPKCYVHLKNNTWQNRQTG